jgi:hypothetical protein
MQNHSSQILEYINDSQAVWSFTRFFLPELVGFPLAEESRGALSDESEGFLVWLGPGWSSDGLYGVTTWRGKWGYCRE